MQAPCYMALVLLILTDVEFSCLPNREVRHSMAQSGMLHAKTTYDVALTGNRPRPIVAAAMARHVASSGAPFGKFSTVFRAYTVNR